MDMYNFLRLLHVDKFSALFNRTASRTHRSIVGKHTSMMHNQRVAMTRTSGLSSHLDGAEVSGEDEDEARNRRESILTA